MIINTRKYKLSTKKYIRMALRGIMIQQWWVFLIFFGICAAYFWIPNFWWIYGACIALILYFLFWLIQFAGITQLEQGKMLFQRVSYEISSKQILIKLSTKQGVPLKWDQIKRAYKSKEGYILFFSKVQIVHFPNKIFNSLNNQRFFESILKRKGLIR